ncbi:MAG: hypothetical protein IT328_14545 [Caldilineaceae bacterium]|nr:hypothetical protein [Caldilineaceae bacterium]
MKTLRSSSVPRRNKVWNQLRLSSLLAMFLILAQVMPAWANSAPNLGPITANPSTPIPFDYPDPVVLTAQFTDADPADTHYITINWDDGTSCVAHGLAADTSGDEYCSIDNTLDTITASHRYSVPGVYAPSISLATEGQTQGGKDGGAYRYVVVVDDTKGHIKGTGGQSPSYPYNQFNSSDGPSQLGFTVGYNSNGTFRTNSRVRFVLADAALNTVFSFSAAYTNFNWMVIDGAHALLSGTGSVNNVAGYTFVLAIIDGDLQNPPGADRYRLQIRTPSGNLYYDNELSPPRDILLFDPTTQIEGGQIAIADAPGMASAASTPSSELVLVGNVPQPVIARAGFDQSLFLPSLSD